VKCSSGNKLLIGIFSDDTNGPNSGKSLLYDTVSGNLLHAFSDPNPMANDFFGSAVDIQGDKVLIGARDDSTNAPGAGQAFLFDAITGNLLQTFDDPNPSPGTGFGSALVIDGDNVLISAREDGNDGPGIGRAFLFDVVSGVLLQTFSDPEPEQGSSFFGADVGIDEDKVIISAPTRGTAYLFDATSGNLLSIYSDPNLPLSGTFGEDIAIDGNKVLFGDAEDGQPFDVTGQAYLFGTQVPKGDYDYDRDVDGADFLAWQRGESPDPLSAADLADWEAGFGSALPLVAAATTVPESSTSFLLLLGMLALLGRRAEHSEL